MKTTRKKLRGRAFAKANAPFFYRENEYTLFTSKTCVSMGQKPTCFPVESTAGQTQERIPMYSYRRRTML
jgi:hypothetical protein